MNADSIARSILDSMRPEEAALEMVSAARGLDMRFGIERLRRVGMPAFPG